MPLAPSELTLARARSRSLLASVIVFSVFTNLLMLTGPLFMLQVYDRVLGSRSEETLVVLFALVGLLYAFYGILEFARGRLSARVGARFQAVFNRRVFLAMLHVSAINRSSNRASTALQDLDAIRSFFASPLVLALFDLPWTPLFLAAIFIFHPVLGWAALAGAIILVIVATVNQVLTGGRTGRGQQLSSAASNFARQAEDGGAFAWSQGMGQALSDRWVGLQNAAVQQSTLAADWTGSFSSFTKAFRFFLQSSMLAVGAWLVLQNEITAGAMIAASIMLGRALAPLEQTIGQWQAIQRTRMAWKHLAKLLGAVPELEDKLELPRPKAHLTVENVTVVAARNAPPILSAVNLRLEPGKAIGVIGKSGSGKSTLARVMVGLLPPSSGEVRLGGATLEQYGATQLGRHIGYLPQDVQFFPGSIAENIAQMSSDPDSDRVVEAAMKARVHDIVLRLPDGYNTRISSDDTRLSGGQRQRLALARALYLDPVLLVLDEPNSALDADGSDALNHVVTEMKADGRAIVLMTHRPTAISSCDQLLVLDHGKTMAYGPAEEVVRSMVKNAAEVQRVVKGAGA